jgi:hypothetical protein
MRATLRIVLEDTKDGDLVFQFRNFGEDVYRSLSDLVSVDINEIDSAIDCFHIRDIKKRQLGRVTKILDRLVRQSGFASRVIVQRTDGSGG